MLILSKRESFGFVGSHVSTTGEAEESGLWREEQARDGKRRSKFLLLDQLFPWLSCILPLSVSFYYNTLIELNEFPFNSSYLSFCLLQHRMS